MESGLEDRNNGGGLEWNFSSAVRLNGVRPRRPEQWHPATLVRILADMVSMESGLEDRNNLLLR